MPAEDVNPGSDDCPHLEVLRLLLEGSLSVEMLDSVGVHVPQCSRCRQTIHELQMIRARTLSLAENREPETGTTAFARTFIPLGDTRQDATDNASTTAPANWPVYQSYAIRGQLGRGGMGIVYDAWDLERNARVALKTLPKVDPSSLYRFKREFRARADLVHPNLVTLYELVAEGDQWFFTMDLLDGSDILAYLRKSPILTPSTLATYAFLPVAPAEGDPTEPELPITAGHDSQADANRGAAPSLSAFQVDPERVASAFRQLAEGLLAVHDAGLLHRDLKPSNVMVTHEGQVVILDFGLVGELHSTDHASGTAPGRSEADQPPRAVTRVGGTVDYMAPEQTIGLELSPACDWYSVGVMLYEALAGRRPYVGSMSEVLTRKTRDDAPPLSSLRPDIDPEWSEFCQRLLSRSPQERPEGREVVEFLSRYILHKSRPDRVADAPAASEFVGRRQILDALLKQSEEAVRTGSALTLVHGRSGVGKSTTIQQFLNELGPALLVRGKCHEQETVPYKAIDSLIDDLVRQLRRLSSTETHAILCSDLSPLARLFPVLQGVLPPTDFTKGENTDPVERRRRAFSAFRDMIRDVSRYAPAVVAIDDFQWGDIDSALMLVELFKPPLIPNLHILISYRSEYEDSSPCVKYVREHARAEGSVVRLAEIAVEPLSPEETRELILRALGDTERARACCEAIIRESRGNPLFVNELIRHVDRKEVFDQLTSKKQLDLGEIYWSTVCRLPEDARRLLYVVALAGKPTRQRSVYQAADLMGRERHAAIALRAGRFMRGTGQRLDDEIEVYHDFLRETILRKMDGDERASLHGALAAVLMTDPTTDPETLASHWIGAGEIEKAGRDYLRAADLAAHALAFERAAKLYQLAITLIPLGEAERRIVERRLADALADAGRSHEAALAYRAVVAGVEGKEWIESQRLAAFHFSMSGHIPEAMDAFRELLAGIGHDVPKSRIRILFSVLASQRRLQKRGRAFVDRPETELDQKQLERFDIIDAARRGIAFIDPFVGNFFHGYCTHMALEMGEAARIIRCLSIQAAVTSAQGIPKYGHSLDELREVQNLAGRLQSPASVAECELSLGMIEYHVANWRSSIAAMDRARGIYGEIGRQSAWDTMCCEMFSFEALARTGAYSELARRYQRARAESLERTNLLALSFIDSHPGPLLALIRDDPAAAQKLASEAVSHWPKGAYYLVHHNALVGSQYIRHYEDDSEAALALIQEQWLKLHWSFLMMSQVIRIGMHGLRGIALASAARQSKKARRLRLASREIANLKRMNTSYSNALIAHIQALIAVANDDAVSSAQWFGKAAERYQALDMEGHAHASWLSQSYFMGGQEASNRLAQEESFFSQQGVIDPRRFAGALSGFRVPGQ